MKKYTIQEIRNYLLSQDSKGDILYNLSEKNIEAAQSKSKENKEWEDEVYDDENDEDWTKRPRFL